VAGKNSKAIRAWMMYDWASQPFHTLLVTFIFAPYFTSHVASDPVSGQAAWGLMLTIAGLIIAFSAPVLGAIADSAGPRKPWMAAWSLVLVASTAMLWLGVPGMEDPTIILIAFALGLIAVEITFVFSNAYMPELVPEEDLGRISGNGWALGYIGGFVTVILVLALLAESSNGKTFLGLDPIFGLNPDEFEGTRAVGPLTALWYGLFIIPFFLWVPEVPKKAALSISSAMSSLWTSLSSLPQKPSLFAYLGSSMFYRDGLNGLYMFGGIYAAGVLGWQTAQLGIFGLIALVAGALGAFVGGRADKAFGSRRVIGLSILVLILTSILTILTTRTHIYGIQLPDGSSLPDIMFYVYGSLIGAFGASLQAASRTMMVHQVDDRSQMTEYFGLYALSGKATAFIAPFSIALMTEITGSQGLGISPVIVLFLIGLVLLYKVRA